MEKSRKIQKKNREKEKQGEKGKWDRRLKGEVDSKD